MMAHEMEDSMARDLVRMSYDLSRSKSVGLIPDDAGLARFLIIRAVRLHRRGSAVTKTTGVEQRMDP